jgi:hypothetical protein
MSFCDDDHDKTLRAKPTCAHSVECSNRIYAAGLEHAGPRGWNLISDDCRGMASSPGRSPGRIPVRSPVRSPGRSPPGRIPGHSPGRIRKHVLDCNDAGVRGVTASGYPCTRSVECSNWMRDTYAPGYQTLHPSCLTESKYNKSPPPKPTSPSAGSPKSKPKSPCHTPTSPSVGSPKSKQVGEVKTPYESAKNHPLMSVHMGRDNISMYVVTEGVKNPTNYTWKYMRRATQAERCGKKTVGKSQQEQTRQQHSQGPCVKGSA